uniref:Carrier domain-containing protein n=1 Tax=Haptolina brevifila TaxID=156173 RepID=A0A7S2HXV1_9EUKA|mmetsp:Transcript_58955/g.117124  ORF Transcript_58955/g.117124 Transcript_58955/m.117124 type:complete len:2584 (+) Transcript_58955:2626-10377(+)
MGRLIDFLHCNNVKLETGKTTTFVERETMAMMHRAFYGFNDGFYCEHAMDRRTCLGHPCSGGTVANVEALWVARNAAYHDCDKKGVMEAGVNGVVLVSSLGHYSLSKAFDILGLGTFSLVEVPTVRFKMSVPALKTKLEELAAAGRKVIAIVAVAGTTETGAFDPLSEIAALAKAHGAWLHVDAAWAGGLIFAPSAHQKLFAGVELADSITVDAHKNLFSTMGFGMVLFRSPHAVKVISKAAQYIIRKDSEDLGKFTLEGSRPANTLQLHACLHALGRSGLQAIMEHKLAVTAAFAKMIDEDESFELIMQPESDILLFRMLQPGARYSGTADTYADEQREADLDLFNVHLQEAQKLQGRTFVSRTAVMDPRRSANPRTTKTTMLRVVVNAHVTVDNCAHVLDDLRIIGNALALQPAPLAEARTLLQALAHSVIHVPHAVAVRTSDIAPPPCSMVGVKGLAQAAKAFAHAIPPKETGGSAAAVGSLTYWQLLHNALHVSGRLLTSLSKPGFVIPILCDRNVDACVAIVACLLRGCAWLMVDSSLPAQRIAHMLSEATPCAEVVVSDDRRAAWENALAKLENKKGIKSAAGETVLAPRFLTPFLHGLRADDESAQRAPPPPPSPVSPFEAEGADAYMIFTSGSTGLPKAVKIGHLQLVHLLRAFIEHWGARMAEGKDTAIAQIAWAWDMHVLDLWLALGQGATVRLLRNEERLDGARVAAVIDRAAAEAAERGGALRWMQGTPTFYRMVVSGGWLGEGGHGLTCISSGESMPGDLARALLLRCNHLVNCYGLTECTIFQSFEELKLPDAIHVDALSRNPATGAMRVPDINCGRACYSYANDDKCEVVLCRVAAGALPLADSDAGDSAEGDDLRHAKEVRAGLPLEKVSQAGVVGQVCFAGTCLPRHGYHNAPDLNEAKFIGGKVERGSRGGGDTLRKVNSITSMPDSSAMSVTSFSSLPTVGSSSDLEVSSDSGGSSSREKWVIVGKQDRADRPMPRMMLSGDLGMWRPDGKLQILGRVDGMVKVQGSRVYLSEVQTALRDNETLVSDAAVIAIDGITRPGAKEGASKELVAYFVPTASANAQAARDGLASVADEVDLWESIYDDAYVKKDAVGAANDENHAVGRKVSEGGGGYDDVLAGLSAEDMITNWSAYISSYSGKLWPRSTIEHWVNATVDRFLDMRPKRMLELGSGNGMLAFRAALRPEVEEVWMADLSGEACRYVEKVAEHPHFVHIKNKCKVLHRPADDFSGIPENHFDVIAMNAMVMYFPSIKYFSDVLRKCSKSLRKGGSVYIGCCRSLEHLQHFHTDVTLFNATDDDASALELRKACLQRRHKEKELLISPNYFYRHKETLPGCFDKVAILLRRGYDCPKAGERGADERHADAPVEMTRWRYDVWLLKGELPVEPGVTLPLDAGQKAGQKASGRVPLSGSRERLQMVEELHFEGRKTLDDAVASMLTKDETADTILVRNVPNARVLDAVACELVIDTVIAEGERRGTPATVGDLRRAIQTKIQCQLAACNGGVGVCPEEFLEYVESIGEGKIGAQMIFTPSADADVNTAAAGTSSAAHLFDVLLYKLRDHGPNVDSSAVPAPPLRECRFRTGELHSMVDYGRMQVAPLLSRLSFAELGAQQLRHTGGNGRHEECYGNKRAWGGVTQALTAALRESLPSYAVPGRFVPVNMLPLLPTGKTDKRHLPSAHAAVLGGSSDRTSAYREPTTPSEQAIVGLFAQYMAGGNAEVKIGIDDDFGELGGTSLSAGRLVAACKRSFGVDLKMGDIFEMRTPSRIAAAVDTAVEELSEEERSSASAAFAKSLSTASQADMSHGVRVVVYDTFVPVPTKPKLQAHGTAGSGAPITMLHARVWRPVELSAKEANVAVIDYAPYPVSFMTTGADDATFRPLAAAGLVCVRVQARGTDKSQGCCGDPYEYSDVHVPDFVAAIESIVAHGLAQGATITNGDVAAATAAFSSVVLHGFSWAATAALRVLALPDGIRPPAIRAACLCMGNDELHESDAFFERRVPLSFNFMWSSQFQAIMARPPTDLATDSVTGASWQQQWVERLNTLGNLPAKYIRAVRDPSRDPVWRRQSLSGQSDPALHGANDEDALLAGLGSIQIPLLAAGAGMLGRYGDTVERLVRSRGVAELRGQPLPEVKGFLGPWVHAYPHLSAVGPNVDWCEMVSSFVRRHTAVGALPSPESTLTFFEASHILTGPMLPARYPGAFCVVSAKDLAQRDCGNAQGRGLRRRTFIASMDGRLVEGDTPPVSDNPVGVVADDKPCGLAGGPWFSWGVGADLPVDQTEDDARSLCFEMAATDLAATHNTCSDGGDLQIRGNPRVSLVLTDAAARRALGARTSGMDCLIVRLCIVDENGVSSLAALGAASLTLTEAVADTRPSSRHDSPPNARLQVDLHFCALRLRPTQKIRLAISSTYFPLFLATGGHGASDLATVELSLPNVGGALVELPPPQPISHPTTLQRVRVPHHERTALLSGRAGAHILQDDGTVRRDDGLAVSNRTDMYVEMRHGRRLAVSTDVSTTMAKGVEHARLQIKTSLVASHDNASEAVVNCIVEATACGAVVWRKTFSTPVAI